MSDDKNPVYVLMHILDSDDGDGHNVCFNGVFRTLEAAIAERQRIAILNADDQYENYDILQCELEG